MICPNAIPAPVAMVRKEATYARSSGGKRSPQREKRSGRHPPTATPVMALTAKSCQYVFTQYVARHGPSPMRTVRKNRRVRGMGLSASQPMTSEAGEPTTKNASWSHPPSLTSFSRSEKPNSSAAWLRLGARRF